MSDDGKSVEPNQSTLAPDFCAGDADVRFLSSDNVEFRIHSNNLNVTCGGFPPSEFKNAEGEFVHLSEDSETLGILFQFVYPRRHPDLNEIKFELLEKVAEAAEKYEVFGAMTTCQLHMSRWSSSHPLGVFSYAFTYGYSTVAELCVPAMLKHSLPEVVDRIPLGCVPLWVGYHALWLERISSTFDVDTSKYAEQKVFPAKTHITANVMDRASAHLVRGHPTKYSKVDARKAFRTALIQQGHRDPEGPEAKEWTYAPTVGDAKFFNSVNEFSRLLEEKLSTFPKFHQYLKDRQARS